MRSDLDRPGDYLPHDADEIEGFKQRLNERLAPTNPKEGDTEWEIGDCLAQWCAGLVQCRMPLTLSQVASQPRNVPLPLPSRPCLPPQGTQEVVPHPPPAEQSAFRAQEYETVGRALV
jgi:hypothetical protein